MKTGYFFKIEIVDDKKDRIIEEENKNQNLR